MGPELAPHLAGWFLAVALGAGIALHPWAGVLGLAVLTVRSVNVGLPGDLEGLSSAWIVVPAILLLASELIVRPRGLTWLVREVVHVPIRILLPPLAVLLAVEGPVQGRPSGILALSVTLAVVITILRWGWTARQELRARRPLLTTFAGVAGAGALAASLSAGAIVAPVPSALLAGIAFVGAMSHPREVFRLAWATPGILVDVAEAVVGGPRWRRAEDLPRWVRRGSAGNLSPPFRGTRALLYGEGPGQGVRVGWMVIGDDGPVFLFRSPTRNWEVALERARAEPGLPSSGPLLQRVRLQEGDDQLVLATPRGGPSVSELWSPPDRLHDDGNL